MVHTTLICSSGLLVFFASSFVPILHFAWLMVLLLLSALLGDLVLLPAILAGPLGRCFERRKNV
jgi:predicted RND superfamily exporter protein